MTREEYQNLVEDAIRLSQNPAPADERRLGEFAARVLRYLEEQGETIAWWDGHVVLPASHVWAKAVPLVPRYSLEEDNDS